MNITKYIGIILSVLYAFVLRILFENNFLKGEFNGVFSITFLFVIPIVMGIIPILFINNKIYLSTLASIIYPFISVLLFFSVSIVSRIEDLICVLIFFFPFFVLAAIAGLITRLLVKNRAAKKGLYSVLIFPIVFNPIEANMPNNTNHYSTQYTITINQNKENVWSYLIEVPEIKNVEYEMGFYNYLGIPRPIKSKLDTVENQIYRTGYFSDNLILKESIESIDTLKSVSFKVHLDKSTLRNKPTDRHVLKTGVFEFGEIKYSLQSVNDQQTQLTLSCDYIIKSKLNSYAYFWANQIIKDFERRLLFSLKLKIEHTLQ